MPVEIRELQITTVVQDSGNAPKSAGKTTTAAPVDTDDIVAKCVEQVMEILKERTER